MHIKRGRKLQEMLDTRNLSTKKPKRCVKRIFFHSSLRMDTCLLRDAVSWHGIWCTASYSEATDQWFWLKMKLRNNMHRMLIEYWHMWLVFTTLDPKLNIFSLVFMNIAFAKKKKKSRDKCSGDKCAGERPWKQFQYHTAWGGWAHDISALQSAAPALSLSNSLASHQELDLIFTLEYKLVQHTDCSSDSASLSPTMHCSQVS